ncbi:trypsin domain-containing protein [Sarocladium implicatum]|nr:trypsin domain-containing protein [Sarocladium implicatum]
MLYKSALLAAAFGLSMAESTLDRRIYYGDFAGRKEFPFLVSLQSSGEHFCGGVLLTGDRILTAAHCSEIFEEGNVTAYGGSSDLTARGKHIKVSKYINHPDYDEDHDIAVWHLERPFCGRRIGFAKLPEQGSDPVDGEMVTMAGWGATENEPEPFPEKLRKATVPIVDREICNSRYLKEWRENWGQVNMTEAITDNMVCAGDISNDVYRGACFGDSGGPALLGSQVVGLMSFNMGCHEAHFPAVTTRVANYVDWIKKNM